MFCAFVCRCRVLFTNKSLHKTCIISLFIYQHLQVHLYESKAQNKMASVRASHCFVFCEFEHFHLPIHFFLPKLQALFPKVWQIVVPDQKVRVRVMWVTIWYITMNYLPNQMHSIKGPSALLSYVEFRRLNILASFSQKLKCKPAGKKTAMFSDKIESHIKNPDTCEQNENSAQNST